jgi:hypothetical protein
VNGLEHATRRRHGGIGEAWTGFGHVFGEAPRTPAMTNTAVALLARRVREIGASSGRGNERKLCCSFIERGRGEEWSAREMERWPAVLKGHYMRQFSFMALIERNGRESNGGFEHH